MKENYINTWIVTGDTHGHLLSRLQEIKDYLPETISPNQVGVIVLGDAGINYYNNRRENVIKQEICQTGFNIYCVRGNHEMRPQDIKGMMGMFDMEVYGEIYIQPEFPNIRYFEDFGTYILGEYKVGVIGGAYSVDKYYRLENNLAWFENEQLSMEEMTECMKYFKNEKVDFMLSHTCPLSWQPVDMFLPFIDQSAVDNSMERMLEIIKNEKTFDWGIWLFGHYHDNRLERPHVEMYFDYFETLDAIQERWLEYDADLLKGREPSSLSWIRKSPNFYKGV